MIDVVDRMAFASERDWLDAVGDALARTGFAVVEGHGVEAPRLSQVEAAARTFFALGHEEKHAVAPRRWNPASPNRYRGYFPSEVDGKDGLDMGDPALGPDDSDLLARPGYEPNRFPASLDDAWHAVVESGFGAMAGLGRRLACGLVDGLGGRSAALAEALERPAAQSTYRFNGYPRTETSDDARTPLACEAHFDSCLLTLLHQDRQGGLEVRDTDGAWRRVPYRPGALVVNTGRALERLTGGRLPATLHRVVATTEPRISVPFFLEPRWDFPLAPSTIGLEDEGAAPMTYEAFLAEAMAVFAEYQDR